MIFENPLNTQDAPIFAPSAAVEAAEPQIDHELKKKIEAIPDKMAFKIGEVAEIVGVKPYVLRYWETEFDSLKPKKSKNNQRMYRRKDVEILLLIKKLLYKDRFSIEGAQGALRRLQKQSSKVKGLEKAADQVEDLKARLYGLINDIQNIKHLFK